MLSIKAKKCKFKLTLRLNLYFLEDLAGAHDTDDTNIACSDENFVEETEIEE